MLTGGLLMIQLTVQPTVTAAHSPTAPSPASRIGQERSTATAEPVLLSRRRRLPPGTGNVDGPDPRSNWSGFQLVRVPAERAGRPCISRSQLPAPLRQQDGRPSSACVSGWAHRTQAPLAIASRGRGLSLDRGDHRYGPVPGSTSSSTRRSPPFMCGCCLPGRLPKRQDRNGS